MADCRGVGFNKLASKQRYAAKRGAAMRQRQAQPTLADFGWKFCGFSEPYPTAVYLRGDLRLTQPMRDVAGNITVKNTETGRVWEFVTTDPAEITEAVIDDIPFNGEPVAIDDDGNGLAAGVDY